VDPSAGSEGILMAAGNEPVQDFRPTFATNRPATNETVAEAINKLLRGMRTNLAETPQVAIATAFFNPGGFRLLADELEHAGHVRLLLGAEPRPGAARLRRLSAARGRNARREQARRAFEKHSRDLAVDRDLLGFTREADADARRLVAWLRGRGQGAADSQRPPVEVRLYRGGFLHGKAFIVSTVLPHVMSGSSNFTHAGLAFNRELNLGQFSPDAVGRVRTWFEELWAESDPYDLAGLYESRWEPHPPWRVFLRMLWELYGAEVEEETASHSATRLGLTGFQADGVWRARRILAQRHGVIIADEVGLGKTYIAGELIDEATVTRRQKVLVVAPAMLRDSTWNPFLRDKNLRADVISFEQLSAGLAMAGRPDAVLQHPDEYAMIVVDEAHALRNAATLRADAMRELLTGRAPKDLVLLTATPVNNSLVDLYTLISYFVPNDAAFAGSGVPSLKGYFDRAMAVNPDDLSPEHLFDVIDQVAVRRTRRFVRHHYIGDKVLINGTEQVIRFPAPRVRRIDYDLGATMPMVFDMLALALGARLPDTSTLPLGTPGEVLSLARYVPSRFRVSARAEQYEQQNAGLLRSILLKRFESSAYAFRCTMTKLIASHDRFLAALDYGQVLTGDALRDWESSDSDDLDDFLNAYARAADSSRPAPGYRLDELRAAVMADQDLLQRLHDAVQIVPWDQDPKFLALVNALAQIAAEAEDEGITKRQIRDKRKVIIFSNYADTAEHLAVQLQGAIATDRRLSAYRDRIALASGPGKHDRPDLLAGFAPRTASSDCNAPDMYDLLIATDVLSEGVNLQQARHIINYDLPWNPMRLVQRHGRIDRIGSEHAEVFVRCFFPDQQLEAMLGLEERLQRKLRQAAAAVGVGEVLPGFAGRDVNFTETRDEIAQLRREEAALFEDGAMSALSGEEFRRTLDRALADASSRGTVLGLPWGAGTGFIHAAAQQPGFVFCARIADHAKPWFRYVPLTPDLQPQTDQAGQVIVIDDTLTCLAHADCGDHATHSVFDGGYDSRQALYNAAFDAWEAAKAHISATWMRNADPANLTRPIPAVMRAAAGLAREHGPQLGDRQDELTERLEAPYAPRIQRAVRGILNDDTLTNQGKAERLLLLADRLGLARQPVPEPLPPIDDDDIHLICWTAVVPRLASIRHDQI
jgi:superfamily II DNA or RNA helicase